MGRKEHLKWLKRRALEYVDRNDLAEAFTSMASDLKKHPETENHPAIVLGFEMLMNGHLDTAEKMRRFVERLN